MKNVYLVVLLFVTFVTGVFAQKSEKCSNSVTVETGAFSSYLEIETAENYHKNGVIQTDVTYERCGNKKTSYGVDVWTSLSVKSNPSGGTELDVVGFVNHKVSESVSVYVDGGVFVYPDNFRIYKANLTVSKKFQLADNVEGTLSNSFSAYKTNDKATSSGVINRVSFDVAKTYKHGTLTVTPSVSIDNNPFNLGNGKVASMGRLYVRYDVPINKKVGFFILGGMSGRIAGDTDRKFHTVAGAGFTFRF